MSITSTDNSLLLSDLLPSLGAHLGVPGFDDDRIGLPASKRYVVVLIDGFGWDLVMKSLSHVPYIAEVIGDAKKVRSAIPSTTSASLMSLWTGVSSGMHGIVGFSFRLGNEKNRRQVTVPLSLEYPLETAPRVMDAMVEASIAVSCVIPAEHIGSGLTLMSTQSAFQIGIDLDDPDVRLDAIDYASRKSDRSVVYVYDSRLDSAGHQYGVASPVWLRTLMVIDKFLADLRARLDDDVVLLVTGDHGMVDVAPEDRIVIDSTPQLSQDLRYVGGEARFRHLYVSQPQAVVERWSAFLGDEASVMTKNQAIEQGCFGKVDPKFLSRIGDVIAISNGGQAYLSSAFPGEFHLVGMHGALTSAERYVPVLID
ncbi:MAG: alkaline phosphatase family protein [Propionibacteriaceae bacterium]|nr:alkaline phosphatase family protein [Propionibacteriaceae bacterium]